jgi:hypothetical protein
MIRAGQGTFLSVNSYYVLGTKLSPELWHPHKNVL